MYLHSGHIYRQNLNFIYECIVQYLTSKSWIKLSWYFLDLAVKLLATLGIRWLFLVCRLFYNAWVDLSDQPHSFMVCSLEKCSFNFYQLMQLLLLHYAASTLGFHRLMNYVIIFKQIFNGIHLFYVFVLRKVEPKYCKNR